MRNKTQERIEELARERARRPTIDLALVEDGIELGKQMMAEMIATYPSPGTSAGAATPAQVPPAHDGGPTAPRAGPARTQRRSAAGGGYLNEVSALSAGVSIERPGADDGVPLLPHGRHRAARRRAESLLVAVLSRTSRR